MIEELERAIYRAIGKASLCWEEQPKGKFLSTKAVEIADELLEEVKHHLEKKNKEVSGDDSAP